ncbi:MAG: DUF1415 domain-containing protein [Thiotrichaceae bacterium]|nr:DUF1415 domain-containing protein [Thiotrichaceae bacterium]PCI11100.1 MAG: hypothetical protein COB71_11685 [Thiotrichales bacterium]PCI13900.1 MAG: hypothetical protein COB71_04325 [Thiotrichales bacterium]
MPLSTTTQAQVIEETRRWLKNIVLRHNLCPFAHKPFKQGTIHYLVSQANEAEAIAESLLQALLALRNSDINSIETTLLITPNCFSDFSDYNEFLGVVDRLIEQLHLLGIIQVASFHPDYQFADLDADDVRNYTNRSLYPMFHLILEESIKQARATHPDVHAIPQTNMDLLEKQGLTETVQQLSDCRQHKPVIDV